MNLLKRFPIVSFFVLAFALDWGIRIAMNVTSIQVAPLKLPAEYAPALAAILVTIALQGKGGVRPLLSRVRAWRLNPWWYILVLVGPAVLGLIAIGLFMLFGGRGVQFQFPGLGVLFLLIIGFLSSLGEEIGWRGFAFPRLQSRSNLVIAGIIVGALWGVWHFPDDITSLSLLAAPSTYINFFWFLSLTVIGSVFMGWVYNRTGGSILLMTFSHMGLTLFWNFVIVPNQVAGQFGPDDLSVILMGIAVVLLVVFTGAKHAAPVLQAREDLSAVPAVEVQERSE